MDFESEFPILLSRRELEVIGYYKEIESEFIAAENFFNNPLNILIRRHAVSIIARHSQGEDPDSYIPYIAMNYFDRYVSRNSLEDVEGADDIDKIRLVAICCLTLSAKMRTKSFSVDRFLRERFVNIDHSSIMTMELRIVNRLSWRMRSVTPFCFLDHYYPVFRWLGGFKRRCINEIIVQAQGETQFVHYTPSQIAFSAFLAATLIAYPSKFDKIEKRGVPSRCWEELLKFCLEKNIEIELGGSGIASASSSSNPTKKEATQERKSKAIAIPTRVRVLDSFEQLGEAETDLIPRKRVRPREETVAEANERIQNMRNAMEVTSDEEIAAETEALMNRLEKQREERLNAALGEREALMALAFGEEIESDIEAELDKDKVAETADENVEIESDTEAELDKDKVAETADENVEIESDTEAELDKDKVAETSDENVAAPVEANQSKLDEDKVAETSDQNVAAQIEADQPKLDDDKVAETSDENVAAQIEASQSKLDEGKVAETSDENVAAQIEASQPKLDEGKVAETSDENVAAQIEASQPKLDEGKVAETSDENVAAPNQPKLDEGKEAVLAEVKKKQKGKSILEIIPAADAVPKKLMNFDLKWPIVIDVPTFESEQQDEPIEESRTLSIRCPETIQGPGSGNDVGSPSSANPCGCGWGHCSIG
ncbi:Cyclin-like [Sesbania bispinosa]|nr:Cyclin-like [Sesbania bispinosa]